MFSGLINQRKENVKIGYVPFYKPNRDVSKILDSWRQQYPSVFNFFPLKIDGQNLCGTLTIL